MLAHRNDFNGTAVFIKVYIKYAITYLTYKYSGVEMLVFKSRDLILILILLSDFSPMPCAILRTEYYLCTMSCKMGRFVAIITL